MPSASSGQEETRSRRFRNAQGGDRSNEHDTEKLTKPLETRGLEKPTGRNPRGSVRVVDQLFLSPATLVQETTPVNGSTRTASLPSSTSSKRSPTISFRHPFNNGRSMERQ